MRRDGDGGRRVEAVSEQDNFERRARHGLQVGWGIGSRYSLPSDGSERRASCQDGRRGGVSGVISESVTAASTQDEQMLCVAACAQPAHVPKARFRKHET